MTDEATHNMEQNSKIRNTTKEEIKEFISKTGTNKILEFDLINGNIITEILHKIIRIITIILNTIFKLPYFPIRWKFAHIIMLLKFNKNIHDPSS